MLSLSHSSYSKLLTYQKPPPPPPPLHFFSLCYPSTRVLWFILYALLSLLMFNTHDHHHDQVNAIITAKKMNEQELQYICSSFFGTENDTLATTIALAHHKLAMKNMIVSSGFLCVAPCVAAVS